MFFNEKFSSKFLLLQFRLNYTIVESAPSTLNALNPILDQTQADRSFQASFQKDCGDDDLCQSQLEVHAELELDKEGMSNTFLKKKKKKSCIKTNGLITNLQIKSTI